MNTEYIKTLWAGPVALLEAVFGIAVICCCAGSSSRYNDVTMNDRELYLIFAAESCFTTTALMFISNLFHQATWTMLHKTVFELLFHSFAFFLYLVGALAVMIGIHVQHYSGLSYTLLLIAAIFAMVNTALYCVSMVFSYKGYKSSD